LLVALAQHGSSLVLTHFILKLYRKSLSTYSQLLAHDCPVSKGRNEKKN